MGLAENRGLGLNHNKATLRDAASKGKSEETWD